VHLWLLFFFFSSRRRHTRFSRDWSSDVCSSDLEQAFELEHGAQACACFAGGCFAGRVATGQQALEFVARQQLLATLRGFLEQQRSEERRVGKECRSRWAARP